MTICCPLYLTGRFTQTLAEQISCRPEAWGRRTRAAQHSSWPQAGARSRNKVPLPSTVLRREHRRPPLQRRHTSKPRFLTLRWEVLVDGVKVREMEKQDVSSGRDGRSHEVRESFAIAVVGSKAVRVFLR